MATVILMASYWLMIFAFVAAGADNGPPPGPPFALGLALVPFVFVALAVISRQPALGGATVAAMLLAVAVALPVSGLAGDAVTGLVAGFGAGGVVALRREVQHSWRARSWAVVLVSTFILVVLRLIPLVGVILAPIITLPSVGAADIYIDYRAEQERKQSETT